MPIITPDTSAAEGPVVIAPGTYPAEIKAIEAQLSKAKSTPMLKVTTAVEYDGKARTRYAYVMTSGPASFQMDQFLRACGREDIAEAIKVPGANVEFDTDELLGKTVNVIVDHELYNNETRDRIKGFLKA